MNIAYVILAHKFPDQLIRLVRRLSVPGSSFALHVDAGAGNEVMDPAYRALASAQNVHFVRRRACGWGQFNQVEASLEGFAELLRLKIPFDYAVLLTGQDYPIKTNEEIFSFFTANARSSFLTHMPLVLKGRIPSSGSAEEQRLLRVYRERLIAWHIWPFGRHIPLPNKYAPVPIRRRFPRGFCPFGGSAHLNLTREAVRYVNDFVTNRPDVVSFFKRVNNADEIFYQTVLVNSPFRSSIVNDDLRFVRWSDPTAGPDIMKTQDLLELAASQKLFARKFDATKDAAVLDTIDRQLLHLPESGRD